jgi:hypothetical protein
MFYAFRYVEALDVKVSARLEELLGALSTSDLSRSLQHSPS